MGRYLRFNGSKILQESHQIIIDFILIIKDFFRKRFKAFKVEQRLMTLKAIFMESEKVVIILRIRSELRRLRLF